MGGSLLGTRVRRTEDPELVTGRGRYIDDLQLADAVHVAFVRSEIAHARLASIDVADARECPGVVDIWTARELAAEPHHGMIKIHDHFARPPLADGLVRFTGEPIAAVLATTAAAARDAADAVVVTYEPLPALLDPAQALEDTAPPIFPEHGDNLALASVDQPIDGILGGADVVVRGRFVNQRIAVASMETNGAAAEIDPEGRLVVYGATQMPHLLHMSLAAALRLARDRVRVVTPLVGGGFGGKAGLMPEQLVVAVAALRLGRPVRWMATRSEDMMALGHGRGQVQYVELGCRRDGTFTGLRVRLVGDGGAYPGVGTFLPTATKRMANGTYHFPAIQCDVAVAVTNTTPMGGYRGAGRPEATAMLERIVDQAAVELGVDPIELRRRNLISDDVFPFVTRTGVTYDTGRYAAALDEAARIAGYEELRKEQAERRARGDRMLLGIGVATYVEITGGAAREYSRVEIHNDGSATIFAGTSPQGQGHQTSFAMIVSDQTGIPLDRIHLARVDTDEVPSGNGTAGSRSLQVGGSAVMQATEALVDKARRIAARTLEADPADIVVNTDVGTIGVAGVPATALSWKDIARVAEDAPNGEVDEGDGIRGLAAQIDFEQPGATFPFGAHISVVEVDVETGQVRPLRHIAVDDCGRVLNPTLVEGQQHGGIAAGVGQALHEEIVYDGAGILRTATFADYGLPSATDLPAFETHSTETPTPNNPLGAKGIGESATVGSTPALQNAVIDALAHLGVRHIDLPCTSEAVWRAIRAVTTGAPADSWSEPPAVFARLAPGTETFAGFHMPA